MLKWLTICFALFLLFSGNAFAQCVDPVNFSLLPTGNYYSEGDTINYTGEFDVQDITGGCQISDVVIRFFPPNDLPADLNNPCDDPGGMVIYENLGVPIYPGEPPVVFNGANNTPIMDYTVASDDSYHLSLLAHMCVDYNRTGIPTSGVAVSTNFLSAPDSDNDGIIDSADNCPGTPNPGQENSDEDGAGNACDDDNDNDSVIDVDDNCPVDANSDQLDVNGNGIGDACEPVSMSGSWSGTYSWDCDDSGDGSRSGTTSISFEIIDNNDGTLSGNAFYLDGSSAINGYRYVNAEWGPWGIITGSSDPDGQEISIDVDESDYYVLNQFSGTLNGNSITGIARNGEGPVEGTQGCSAALTESGTFQIIR